jgi:DNA-binding NtrC family response regulator
MKISTEAMEHLMRYHWPGNARELGNLIERAVVLARGAEIMPEDLPLLRGTPSSGESPLGKPYHDAVRHYQREVIRHALQSSGGNQARTAELLGLQRTYLARLIKKFNINCLEAKRERE